MTSATNPLSNVPPRLDEHDQNLPDWARAAEVLLQNLPVIFWSTDIDLRMTASHGSGLAAFGVGEGELVGRSLMEWMLGRQGREATVHLRAHLDALRGEFSRYSGNWRGKEYQAYVGPIRSPEGRVVGCTGVSVVIVPELRTQREEGADMQCPPLTSRQREILTLLANGASTFDVAAQLKLEHATVRNHIARLLVRMGVHSRLEAIARGRKIGLID